MKIAIISESSFGYKDTAPLKWLVENREMIEPIFREKTVESRMIPKAGFKTYHMLKTHKNENKWQTLSRVCRAAHATIILRGTQTETKGGIERNHKILNWVKNYSRQIYLLHKENGEYCLDRVSVK